MVIKACVVGGEQTALTIEWRRWLIEEALRHYYARNNYLHLQLGHTAGGHKIDNPDQVKEEERSRV